MPLFWEGWMQCLVKGVQSDLPHAIMWVRVRRDGPGRWYFQPPKPREGVYRRGTGGTTFKLLPETFREQTTPHAPR